MNPRTTSRSYVLLGREHLQAVTGRVQVGGEVLSDGGANLRLGHLLNAGALLEESLVDGMSQRLDLLINESHGAGPGGLDTVETIVELSHSEQEPSDRRPRQPMFRRTLMLD